MRLITLTCPDCGTILAGNVLEDERVLKCPGLDCATVHRFEELPEADREYILKNREQYRLPEA